MDGTDLWHAGGTSARDYGMRWPRCSLAAWANNIVRTTYRNGVDASQTPWEDNEAEPAFSPRMPNTNDEARVALGRLFLRGWKLPTPETDSWVQIPPRRPVVARRVIAGA